MILTTLHFLTSGLFVPNELYSPAIAGRYIPK